MIGGDAVLDGLYAGIVRAAFDLGPVAYAFHNHLVRNHDADNGAYFFGFLCQNGVQCLCLCYGAWESVQKEAIYAFHAGELGFYHSFHHLIRNEFAVFDKGFCLEAEFRACLDFLAEQVTGGDVVKPVPLCHCCGLGAFACTRRAEKDVVFHRLYLSDYSSSMYMSLLFLPSSL